MLPREKSQKKRELQTLNWEQIRFFDVAVNRIPHKANEPAHWHYDINFLFLVEDHKFEISDESLQIKWVTVEEAKKYINPDDAGMLRMIEKYKKMLPYLDANN